jgi:hypothetical protein
MESSYKKLHLQGSALPPTASGLSLAKPEVTHFFEHSQPERCNSQPATCNPQPATRNSQPATCNPQPATRNPQHATCNPQSLGVDAFNKEK